jgi:hypothetical protein
MAEASGKHQQGQERAEAAARIGYIDLESSAKRQARLRIGGGEEGGAILDTGDSDKIQGVISQVTHDHSHWKSDGGIHKGQWPRKGNHNPGKKKRSKQGASPKPQNNPEQKDLDPGAAYVLLSGPCADPEK